MSSLSSLPHRVLATQLAGVLCIATPMAHAALTWTVNTCNDDNTGSAMTNRGSLRFVTTNAASGDTIDLTGLTCSPITLNLGEIAIAQDSLTITGPGRSSLTIDAAKASRVFHHTGHQTLTIESVTLANGSYNASGAAFGGCIFSSGNVTVNRSVVSGCTARSTGTGTSALGGAIYSQGKTAVAHSTLENNSAYAHLSAVGGAVFSGAFAATYSSFDGNKVQTDVFLGQGGAVNSYGYITIDHSEFSGNSADRMGGALFIGYAHGAASYIASISNTTISGNRSTYFGAGIVTAVRLLTVANSTIVDNAVGVPPDNSSPVGIGIYNLAAYSDVLILNSSIVANNVRNDGTTHDLSWDFNTGGFVAGADNLVTHSDLENGASGLLIVSSAQPLLGPLQFNGGETRTRALLPGSPAIGNGKNSLKLDSDQRGRGYPRTTGPASSVDIGAFQYDSIFADGYEEF